MIPLQRLQRTGKEQHLKIVASERIAYMIYQTQTINSFISWSDHNITFHILNITFNIGPHVKGGGSTNMQMAHYCKLY